jgi:hypothetical protein
MAVSSDCKARSKRRAARRISKPVLVLSLEEDEELERESSSLQVDKSDSNDSSDTDTSRVILSMIDRRKKRELRR